MIQLILADDHVLIREGIKKVLTKAENLHVTFEAGTAQEVLDYLEQNSVDLIVLDINLPGMSGLDAIKYIHRLSPQTKVLMLSMYSEDRFAIRALKAGAVGYLTKASAADELIDAINQVMAGGHYLTNETAQVLASSIGDSDRLPHETLSEREFQIFRMIAVGKSVKEIAHDLVLSVNTINTYRARIMEKMKMNSTQDLVRYSFDNGLTE